MFQFTILLFHSRPKSYACRLEDNGTKKALKGIGRSVTKNEISFDDYQRTLETGLPQRHVMNVIRSIDHRVLIQNVEKTSLSLWDDKRYWLSQYESVPYGHPLSRPVS